jgi:hypothetical protein
LRHRLTNQVKTRLRIFCRVLTTGLGSAIAYDDAFAPDHGSRFRVFGHVARATGVPAAARPLGIRCPFRVSGPSKYRGYRFRAPALPLAIPSALRCSLDALRQPQLSDRCILSSGFAFLQRLAQRVLAGPPQRTSSSHGLSFPSALAGSEVHTPRALPARFVPPSGFGYPLGGLLPPSPCRLFFTPAALLGFTLRSFLLPEGIRRVSAGKDPRTVSPAGIPAAEAVSRPSGPRFLGFDPSGSPWRPDAGLVRRPLAAPLGFALPRYSSEGLARDFARTPPTRFCEHRASRPGDAGAPESQSALARSRPRHPASRVRRTERPS